MARPRTLELSPEILAAYIHRGKALRARYIRHLARRLWSGLGRPSRARLVHDLRTPLTSIRSFSEILRDHPDLPSGQRARYLEIILAESARLERVISRHEGGRAPCPAE